MRDTSMSVFALSWFEQSVSGILACFMVVMNEK